MKVQSTDYIYSTLIMINVALNVDNSSDTSHFHLKPHLHHIEYEPECHALGFGLNINSTAKLHPVLLTSPFNYKI